MKTFKLTIGNYTYALKRLTTGKHYITRTMTSKAFKKFLAGKLSLRSGIVNIW